MRSAWAYVSFWRDNFQREATSKRKQLTTHHFVRSFDAGPSRLDTVTHKPRKRRAWDRFDESTPSRKNTICIVEDDGSWMMMLAEEEYDELEYGGLIEHVYN